MIKAKVDLGNLENLTKQFENLNTIFDDKEIIKGCVDKAYQTLMDFTTDESLMRSTAFLGNSSGWRSGNELDKSGKPLTTNVNDNLGYYHWSDGERTASHNKKEIINKYEGRIYNDLDYIYEIEFGNPMPYDYELDETTYNRYVKRGYPESYPNSSGKYEGHTEGYEGLGIFYRTDLTLESELDIVVENLVQNKITKILKE